MNYTIPSNISIKKWVQITLSFDKENNKVMIFMNGQLSSVLYDTSLNMNKSSELMVGKSFVLPDQAETYLDELEIYAEPLSTVQVYNNYQSYNIPKIKVNEWNNVFVSYNNINKEVSVINNGKLLGYYDDVGIDYVNTNDNPIILGRFSGQLGDIHGYSQYLSSNETNVLYKPEHIPVTLFNFNMKGFDMLNYKSLIDYSNFQNNGILVQDGSYVEGYDLNTSALSFDGGQKVTVNLDNKYNLNNSIISLHVKGVENPSLLTSSTLVKIEDKFELGINKNNYLYYSVLKDVEYVSDPITMNLVRNENLKKYADDFTNGIYGSQTRKIVLYNEDVVYSSPDVLNTQNSVLVGAGEIDSRHIGNLFIPFINQGSTDGWNSVFVASSTSGPTGTYVSIMYTFTNGPKELSGAVLQNGNENSGTTYVAGKVEFYYIDSDQENIITASDRSQLIQMNASPSGQNSVSTGEYTKYTFDSSIVVNQIEIRLYHGDYQTANNYISIGSLDFIEIPNGNYCVSDIKISDTFKNIHVYKNDIDRTISFYEDEDLINSMKNVSSLDVSSNSIIIGENFVGALSEIRFNLGHITSPPKQALDYIEINNQVESQQIKILGVHGTTGTLQENNTRIQFNVTSWHSFRTDIIIDTSKLKTEYIFELSWRTGSNPYLTFYLAHINYESYSASSSTHTNLSVMMLNIHSTISAHASAALVNIKPGTTQKELKYWKLTIVERPANTLSRTQPFNDILIEGFIYETRTEDSRVLWTYASEMCHYSRDKSILFEQHSQFRIGLGGHQTGGFYFQDFKEIPKQPSKFPIIYPDYNTKQIVGQYHFNGSSTVQFFDSSITQNHASNINSVQQNSIGYKQNSKSIVFKKSMQQYVQISGSSYNPNLFNNVSLSIWVKIDSTLKQEQTLLLKENIFKLCINDLNIVKFVDLTNNIEYTSTIEVEDVWVFIALSIDQYNQKIDFYKNGEVDSILNCSINFPLNNTNIKIGVEFEGELDVFTIHEGILSDIEHLENYHDMISVYEVDKIASDTWVHVSAVYDKYDNTVYVYKNGYQCGCYENYLVDFSNIGVNDKNIYIATKGDNVTFYDGKMDDIRIYDKALTDNEINELHKLYVSHKLLINGDFEPSYHENRLVFNTIELREPNNMIVDKSIAYYIFAIADDNLNGVAEIKLFVNTLNQLPQDTHNKHILTLTGTENTTNWNPSSLNTVFYKNHPYNVKSFNNVTCYVVGLAYDNTCYYLKKNVQISEGSQVYINTVTYEHNESVLKINLTLFNSVRRMTKIYVAAFENDVTNSFTYEYIHNAFRASSHLFSAIIDISPNKLTPLNISINKSFVDETMNNTREILDKVNYKVLCIVEDDSYEYKSDLGQYFQFVDFNVEGTSEHRISGNALTMNNTTSEKYLTTGITINMSDEHIGDEFLYEMYWDVLVDGQAHGGMSIQDKNTSARRQNNGFYIDFYQYLPETNKTVIRYPTPTLITMYKGYVFDNYEYNGPWAKYFKITIVPPISSSSSRNDLKMQAYLDEDRTDLLWEIPSLYALPSQYQLFNENQVYINLWNNKNALIFKNFQKKMQRTTPLGIGIGNYLNSTIIAPTVMTLSKYKQSRYLQSPVFLNNGYEFTYNNNSWGNYVFNETIIDTSDTAYYEFELGTLDLSAGGGYLILAFYKNQNMNLNDWNSEGGNSAVLLMNINDSGMSRHDAGDYTWTTMEQPTTTKYTMYGTYWRLSMVNRGTFNDILYEVFIDSERTSRTMWGYGSRMYHGPTDRASLFQSNSIFYMGVGGHPGGSHRYFKNFTKFINTPKPIYRLTDISLYNVSINTPFTTPITFPVDTKQIEFTETNFQKFNTVVFNEIYNGINTIRIGSGTSEAFLVYDGNIDLSKEYLFEVEYYQANGTSNHFIMNLGTNIASPTSHSHLKGNGYYIMIRGDGQLYNDSTDYNNISTNFKGNQWHKLALRYTPYGIVYYIDNVIVGEVQIGGSLSSQLTIGTQTNHARIRSLTITENYIHPLFIKYNLSPSEVVSDNTTNNSYNMRSWINSDLEEYEHMVILSNGDKVHTVNIDSNNARIVSNLFDSQSQGDSNLNSLFHPVINIINIDVVYEFVNGPVHVSQMRFKSFNSYFPGRIDIYGYVNDEFVLVTNQYITGFMTNTSYMFIDIAFDEIFSDKFKIYVYPYTSDQTYIYLCEWEILKASVLSPEYSSVKNHNMYAVIDTSELETTYKILATTKSLDSDTVLYDMNSFPHNTISGVITGSNIISKEITKVIINEQDFVHPDICYEYDVWVYITDNTENGTLIKSFNVSSSASNALCSVSSTSYNQFKDEFKIEYGINTKINNAIKRHVMGIFANVNLDVQNYVDLLLQNIDTLNVYASNQEVTQIFSNEVALSHAMNTNQVDGGYAFVNNESLQQGKSYKIVLIALNANYSTTFTQFNNDISTIGYNEYMMTFTKANVVSEDFYDWKNNLSYHIDFPSYTTYYNRYYVMGPKDYIYSHRYDSKSIIAILKKVENTYYFTSVRMQYNIGTNVIHIKPISETHTVFLGNTKICVYDNTTDTFIDTTLTTTAYNNLYRSSVCANKLVYLDGSNYLNVYMINDDFTYDFIERFNNTSIFDYTNSRISDRMSDNRFVIYRENSYTLHVFQWDGYSFNNIYQTIELDHLFYPYQADLSENGTYLFISGYSTTVNNSNTRNHGMMYIYKKQGDTYTKIGSVSPDIDNYENKFGYKMCVQGNYVSVYSYNCYKSSTSGDGYEQRVYMYEFNDFNFNYDYIYVHKSTKTNTFYKINHYDNYLMMGYSSSVYMIDSIGYNAEIELRYPPASLREEVSPSSSINTMYDEYNTKKTTWTLDNLKYGNGTYEVYSSTTAVNTSHHVSFGFNNNLTGATWHPPNTGATWIYFIIPDEIVVTKYAIITNTGYISHTPKTWNFYGKIADNNPSTYTDSSNSTYTLLDSRTNEPNGWMKNERKEFILNSPSTKRFNMFKFENIATNGSYAVIPVFQVYGLPNYIPKSITNLSYYVHTQISELSLYNHINNNWKILEEGVDQVYDHVHTEWKIIVDKIQMPWSNGDEIQTLGFMIEEYPTNIEVVNTGDSSISISEYYTENIYGFFGQMDWTKYNGNYKFGAEIVYTYEHPFTPNVLRWGTLDDINRALKSVKIEYKENSQWKEYVILSIEDYSLTKYPHRNIHATPILPTTSASAFQWKITVLSHQNEAFASNSGHYQQVQTSALYLQAKPTSFTLFDPLNDGNYNNGISSEIEDENILGHLNGEYSYMNIKKGTEIIYRWDGAFTPTALRWDHDNSPERVIKKATLQFHSNGQWITYYTFNIDPNDYDITTNHGAAYQFSPISFNDESNEIDIDPLKIKTTIFGSMEAKTNMYVFGTTQNLSKNDVKTFISNDLYSGAIYKNDIERAEYKTFDLDMHYIIDEDNSIVPSSYVNNMKIWVYAFDGIDGEDARIYSVNNFNVPKVNIISSEFYSFENKIKSSFTVYDSKRPITNVYASLTSFNTEILTTEEFFTTFWVHNMNDYEGLLLNANEQNTILEIDAEFAHVFHTNDIETYDDHSIDSNRSYYLNVVVLNDNYNGHASQGFSKYVKYYPYYKYKTYSENFLSITKFITYNSSTSFTEHPDLVNLKIRNIYQTFGNSAYIVLEDSKTVYFYGMNYSHKGISTSNNVTVQPTISDTIQNYINENSKTIRFICGGYGGCCVVFDDNHVASFGHKDHGAFLNATSYSLVDAYAYVHGFDLTYRNIDSTLNSETGLLPGGFVPQFGFALGQNSICLIVYSAASSKQRFLFSTSSTLLNDINNTIDIFIHQMYDNGNIDSDIKYNITYAHAISQNMIVYKLTDVVSLEAKWYYLKTNSGYSTTINYLPSSDYSDWNILHTPIHLDLFDIDEFIYKIEMCHISSANYMTYVKTNIYTNESKVYEVKEDNEHSLMTDNEETSGYVIAYSPYIMSMKLENVDIVLEQSTMSVTITALHTNPLSINAIISSSSETVNMYFIFATSSTLSNNQVVDIIEEYIENDKYDSAITSGIMSTNKSLKIENEILENALEYTGPTNNSIISASTLSNGTIWLFIKDESNKNITFKQF